MKLKLVNSKMIFSKVEYQEIQVSSSGKEQGFYGAKGNIDTSYYPEKYMHQEFTFEPIETNAYAILNNTSTDNVKYGIVVLFSGTSKVKVYTVEEVGKSFTNLKIEIPIGVDKIGMSVTSDNTCDVKVFKVITQAEE